MTCTRCRGRLLLERTLDGSEWACISCSHRPASPPRKPSKAETKPPKEAYPGGQQTELDWDDVRIFAGLLDDDAIDDLYPEERAG